MASVLQVIGAIERIANAAVDIARIVTHRLGIPRELVADLSNAEEVSHRVLVREGSHLARRPLAALELPVRPACGSWPSAGAATGSPTSRARTSCVPGDVLFLRGSPAGIVRLRELAAAPVLGAAGAARGRHAHRPRPGRRRARRDEEHLRGGRRPRLLARSCSRDPGLAAEVRHLEDRLDEMKDRLELWVLRAARDDLDPAPLRGLLHLSQAAEDLGDQAQQMVWLIEQQEELHPILRIALGESDEVVVRVPVGAGLDGRRRHAWPTCSSTSSPGFHVLAIRRGGRYLYRPRGQVQLEPGDELIASGPDEGHPILAERCGWRLIEDEDTNEDRSSRSGSDCDPALSARRRAGPNRAGRR